MTVTVFIWNMGSRGPDGTRGVGHAAMGVTGPSGNIYVSFWPAEHSASAGWSSQGKAHFVNGDRLWDGNPHWASKPLTGLNEQAIIEWWSKIQRDPLIDYKKKKPFQVSTDKDKAHQETQAQYRILNSQCATTVVAGLLAGANADLKKKIESWIADSATHVGVLPLPFVRTLLPATISPTDVKRLIVDVWEDTEY